MDRLCETGSFQKSWSTFRRWTSFPGWTGPIENWPLPLFEHFGQFSNPVLRCSVFLCPTWRKSLILETFGLLTADLLVLLVYPCAVTTGLKLLFRPSVCFGSVLKRFISRDNLECLGMFFSSYGRCLNSQANIWVRFAKNSPLYRLNY